MVASDRHFHSCCLSPPLRREFRVSPGARAAQVRPLSLPVGWGWRWWGVASRPHPCPRVILLPLSPPGWLVWVPFAGAFFPRLRWQKVPVGDLAPLFLPRALADPAAPVGTPAALPRAGFSGWPPQRLPSRGCGGHRSALVITHPSHYLGLLLIQPLLFAPLTLISARAFLRVSTDAASTPVRLS